MNHFTTGQFAKLANVTERTIRYYDKIGLLKPCFVMSNGYRQYTEEDLLKLQKILSLKKLGFTIEEIFPMVLGNQNLKESFHLQMELIDSKIKHLSSLKDSMRMIVNSLEDGQLDWNRMIQLIQLSNEDSNIIEHYKNAKNLDVRILLHEKYSVNPVGWFPWVLKQIDFSKVNCLLEVGCGNGKLWENNTINLRNREIFLSDASSGMVEEVRNHLGSDFNCMCFECEQIPFKDNYFDTVLANHVLFYAHDVKQAIEEIARVLKQNGMFYCSTYGKKHMKEISDLVHEFDSSITLSEFPLYERFGLENGEELLSSCFEKVECRRYEDALIIHDPKPIVDYISSCHGNQNEKLSSKYDEFLEFIEDKIQKGGSIQIAKDAGLFVCRK